MNKLDELVAKVKGWRRTLIGSLWIDNNGDDANLPDWQSDISSAMGLVDELRGYAIFKKLASATVLVHPVTEQLTVDVDGGEIVATHKHLPTAICIAYCRYKGVAEEEISKALEGT